MILKVIFSIIGLLTFLFILLILFEKLKKRRISKLLVEVFSKHIEVPVLDYYYDKDGDFISLIFSFQDDYDKALKLGLLEEFKDKFKKIKPDSKYFNVDEMLIFDNRGRIRKI